MQSIIALYHKLKSKSLWTKCILVSICLHLVLLAIFFKLNVDMKAPKPTLFNSNQLTSNPTLPQPTSYLVDNNKKIHDFFSEFVSPSSQFHHPYDYKVCLSKDPCRPTLEEARQCVPEPLVITKFDEPCDPTFSSSQLSLSTTEEHIDYHSYLYEDISEQQPHIEKEDRWHSIAEILCQSAFVHEEEESEPILTFDQSYHSELEERIVGTHETLQNLGILSETESLSLPDIVTQEDPFNSLNPSPTLPLLLPEITHALYTSLDTLIAVHHENAHLQKNGIALSANPYSIKDKLALVGWNDYFSITPYIGEKNEEGRYPFALIVKPASDMQAFVMKQNFLFLIDRSNSIERHRYNSFKKAVLKSLSALSENDNFNICIFDEKISRLSDDYLPQGKNSIAMAEKFLDKQAYKGYFSATDIYESLNKLIQTDFPENEVTTVILISDGDTLLSKEKQRDTIKGWLENHHHRISLYSAAIGRKNNLFLLSLLSSLCRGNLIHSDTHSSFPRKLSKLITDLRHPIASEVSATIVTNEQANTILYQSNAYFPTLHYDESYILYGETTNPSSQTFILQAKQNGNWIALQKQIDFENASPLSPGLTKEAKASKSTLFFDHFIQEGKHSALDQAQKVLQSIDHIATRD